MTMSRRAFLNTCLGLGVVAVAARNASPVLTQQAQWMQFGTLVDVTLRDVEPELASPVLADLSASLQRMNDDWHPWQPGVMAEINQAIASQAPIQIDAHMQAMLTQVQSLHRLSNGTFNPAIGHVVNAWGFHGQQAAGWQPPAVAQVQRLLASSPSPLDLEMQGKVLSSRNPQVRIDLGGYAKGYALQQGMRLLEQKGVQNALINAGGDLLTLGEAQPGILGRPWRVAVRHPQRPGSIAWLDVSGGEAVLTSGNYERFRNYQGQRFAHIIDPRSGMPARDVASATVIHRDAALGDAAATALVVSGMRDWRETATALGLQHVMMVDAQGKVEMTPEMQERVQLS